MDLIFCEYNLLCALVKFSNHFLYIVTPNTDLFTKTMKTFYFLTLNLILIGLFPVLVNAKTAPDNMVFIKGGCYMMGTDEKHEYEEGRDNSREQPAHKVCLDDFFLDKYEITQKQFMSAMGTHASIMLGDDFPVDHMTFEQAVNYCKKRGARLPTEAEWEYAARAGSQTLFPWGDEMNGDYVWYVTNSVRKPHPVGSRKPNAWGLHDMMGSVWEWVSDWYSESYFAESPEKNPQGPQTRRMWRVIRGLSWVDEEELFRVTRRQYGMADPTEHYLVGARCAKSAGEAE